MVDTSYCCVCKPLRANCCTASERVEVAGIEYAVSRLPYCWSTKWTTIYRLDRIVQSRTILVADGDWLLNLCWVWLRIVILIASYGQRTDRSDHDRTAGFHSVAAQRGITCVVGSCCWDQMKSIPRGVYFWSVDFRIVVPSTVEILLLYGCFTYLSFQVQCEAPFRLLRWDS